METKHTATPWKAEESTVASYTGYDVSCAAPGNARWIASVHSAHGILGTESPEALEKKQREIAEAKANSEFIVRACNAHDDLVKALQDILNAKWTAAGISEAHADAARAAIAKARAA